MSIEKAIKLIREPRRINAAQITAYTITALTGLLAAVGGVPAVINGTIGPVLAVAVGSLLVVGGSIGSFSVIVGHWWLERIALRVVGLGWAVMLVPCLFYAVIPGKSSAIWLIVALVVVAIADTYKRYVRIDWAYLDPTRP